MSAPPHATSHARLALAVIAANAMDVVATAVQTVAAPEMAGGLRASVDEAAWLNVAYLAAKVFAFVLVPGWVDAVGAVAVLRRSVAGLMCATLVLCWPHGGLAVAYLGRAAQGAFGAGVVVVGMTLLLDRLQTHHHAWAQAAFSSTTMLGPSLFAALCGATSDFIDWRLAMAWALPCGVLASWAVRKEPLALPDASAAPKARRSAITLGLWAVFAVGGQFVVARGTRYNWADRAWLPWLVAAACLSAVAAVWRLRARRGAPLDAAPFGLSEFRFACATAVASAYGAGASAMLMPALMRQIYRWASADVGEAHLPSALACGAGLLLSAAITSVRPIDPVKLIYAGLALFGGALGLLTVATLQADMAFLTAVLALRGFAFGLLSVPTAVVAFSRLRGHALCHGVAAYQVLRQMGTSLATLSVTWRLAETQARFSYQFATHLSPIDPTAPARVGQGALQLVHRGVAPGAGARAGFGQMAAAVASQVQLLSYRACAQEILLVFLGCMALAMAIRSRVVPPAQEAG